MPRAPRFGTPSHRTAPPAARSTTGPAPPVVGWGRSRAACRLLTPHSHGSLEHGSCQAALAAFATADCIALALYFALDAGEGAPVAGLLGGSVDEIPSAYMNAEDADEPARGLPT